jgi:hypothetical protein
MVIHFVIKNQWVYSDLSQPKRERKGKMGKVLYWGILSNKCRRNDKNLKPDVIHDPRSDH